MPAGASAPVTAHMQPIAPAHTQDTQDQDNASHRPSAHPPIARIAHAGSAHCTQTRHPRPRPTVPDAPTLQRCSAAPLCAPKHTGRPRQAPAIAAPTLLLLASSAGSPAAAGAAHHSLLPTIHTRGSPTRPRQAPSAPAIAARQPRPSSCHPPLLSAVSPLHRILTTIR